jgi:hypothetical protein
MMQRVRLLAIAACIVSVSAGALAVTMLLGVAGPSTTPLVILLLVLGSTLISVALVLRSRARAGGGPQQH